VTKGGLVVCMHEPENKEPLIHEKLIPPPPAGLDAQRPEGTSGS
jgi:hypothetical protein